MNEYKVKEFSDGTKAWYLNGKLHGEDGSAIKWSNGSKVWWLNGERHREEDILKLQIKKDKEEIAIMLDDLFDLSGCINE